MNRVDNPVAERDSVCARATMATMDFEQLRDSNGGVFRTGQLMALGYGQDEIRQALDGGYLTRVRHGFLALADADPLVVAAVGDRGVLSCASALRRHGLWVPRHDKSLHVRVTRYERRQSHDRCRRYGRPTPASGAVDDVLTALAYAARCFDEEGFIILCDSALNSGKVNPWTLRQAFAQAPAWVRAAIEKTERGAASGTESAVRLRLRAKGLTVVVQHHVPGVGYVDLLIGRRLVLELDSFEHHTGEENYEEDRRRDNRLIALGYLPMRLTYAQVFTRWDAAYADLQAVIRSDRHRRPVA